MSLLPLDLRQNSRMLKAARPLSLSPQKLLTPVPQHLLRGSVLTRQHNLVRSTHLLYPMYLRREMRSTTTPPLGFSFNSTTHAGEVYSSSVSDVPEEGNEIHRLHSAPKYYLVAKKRHHLLLLLFLLPVPYKASLSCIFDIRNSIF